MTDKNGNKYNLGQAIGELLEFKKNAKLEFQEIKDNVKDEFQEVKTEIKGMRSDIKNLMSWKIRVVTIASGVSAAFTFLFVSFVLPVLQSIIKKLYGG